MNRIRYGAKTDAELINKEVQATKIGAWSTALTGTFLTDPAIIAAVLPPPLRPPKTPLVKVSISRVDLGRGLPPFGAGTFAVAAIHDGPKGQVEGFYPLLMPMTTEQSVIGGRETFGEPKKLAQITQDRDGNIITATVARMGSEIIRIAGSVEGKAPEVSDEERVDFYFKFLPHPSGSGFDSTPQLAYCYRQTQTQDAETVNGSITLGESRFDPVADFRIESTPQITLSKRRSQQSGEIICEVDPDALKPFVHQRYDDLSPIGKPDDSE